MPMTGGQILLVLAALAVAGYLAGRWRAAAVLAAGAPLHSRAGHHGLAVAMAAFLAGLGVFVLLNFLAIALPSLGQPQVLGVASILLAVAAFVAVFARIAPRFRARNLVEAMILGLLMCAASIAIFTTVAIALSLVFETARFFGQYSWRDFFFGTVWSPAFQGTSQLGMLPLLWGTLYVSFIALAVAVPVGLFIAIYLTQYATTTTRRAIKPAIEILAGIPSIVYGLFALVTVGPILRDWIAQPTGLGSSAASVATAGLVMGIMLIPYVSSLSDDIINAVPRSMTEGSLGLGATRSETIRRVIIPAALPGIVGAFLLAASRAIGETMIVVLGAGAAARLSLNPFEAMTTVTVKIVSQLTGDTDFNSPETLVAFALGITLFTLTLAMNVLALYIVRRYREQYE
ncbi:phosphate ABC transporter permease subunit PstC [Amaricoccus sp.]|uniref:phosphate ABC transporter permease subunit PstC n=1 Tax=Amaricoccus sp. TaxID=1872485 RepID=UPI001B5C6B92|nr:phosphate ABC transporter permease subunit PstC [Amaricoccus sp.]MBP7002396.1 phosphate ABC transporter permease subunit PstC [Amaricoccus sp.]